MSCISSRNSAMRALRTPRRPQVACPPLPTPSTARPPLMSSTVAMALTSRAECRSGVGATPVPRSSFSVRCAASARPM